jgi:hypothetical protein
MKGDARAAEFPDLLHPNDAGYAKWAAALRPIFATLGFLETEADDFEPESRIREPVQRQGPDRLGISRRRESEKAAGKCRPRPSTAKPPAPTAAMPPSTGDLVVTTPARGPPRAATLDHPRSSQGLSSLKLEFRATPNADSGVFIRQPQLQCRDYPLAGPYKMLKQYKAQDWNELVVTVKGGVAHCTCNGEVLEEALAAPATGPIGLEGDRGQMEYRRIRVIEE